MVKALLFDLDGTLLPMDTYAFAEHYMKLLLKAFGDFYGDKRIQQWTVEGVEAMLRNTTELNRDAFFTPLIANTGISAEEFENKLLPFYSTVYPTLRDIYCARPEKKAVQAVHMARKKGLKTVLSTNPLFPRVAVEARIRWAGLEMEDFDEITTYETYRAAKPRPEYFRQILETIKLTPEECVMVGNDCKDDLPAGALGIGTFWLTEFPLNFEGQEPVFDFKGGYEQLLDWIKELPQEEA